MAAQTLLNCRYIGVKSGVLGMKAEAVTKIRNKTYLAGQTSLLKDGLHLAATANRTKNNHVHAETL